MNKERVIRLNDMECNIGWRKEVDVVLPELWEWKDDTLIDQTKSNITLEQKLKVGN